MAWVSMMDVVYPVGSLYMTTLTTSPADSVGGTWTLLTDDFYPEYLKSDDTWQPNWISADGNINAKTKMVNGIVTTKTSNYGGWAIEADKYTPFTTLLERHAPDEDIGFVRNNMGLGWDFQANTVQSRTSKYGPRQIVLYDKDGNTNWWGNYVVSFPVGITAATKASIWKRIA